MRTCKGFLIVTVFLSLAARGFGQGGAVSRQGEGTTEADVLQALAMAPAASDASVLVVPASDMAPGRLEAIVEDMRVMSHIFEQQLSGGGSGFYGESMLSGLRALFEEGQPAAQRIYIEGFGALFVLKTDMPLSQPPGTQSRVAEGEAGTVDATWQQARQAVLYPGRKVDRNDYRRDVYDAARVEGLKESLVRAMKHAANIRQMKATDWVILTVQSGTPVLGVSYRMSTYYSVPSGERSYGGGAGGGYGFGGAVGMGGGARGAGGVAKDAVTSPVTVMTIRALRSDIDAFARGEVNYEQFREKVQILMY